MEGHGNLWSEMSRPARYEEIEALPEGMVGQIIGGELVALPRPSGEHTVAAGALGAMLTAAFQFPPAGGWWILPEREVHLGGNVLVPDLAGWRKSRLERPSGPFETLAPDWVCEVLSPSTARIDRVRKMAIYAAEGVDHVWLVDPLARSLEAYRRDGSHWLRLGGWDGEARVSVEPFSEREIELSALWPGREAGSPG